MEIVLDEYDMKIIDIYNGKEVEGYSYETYDRIRSGKLIGQKRTHSIEFDVIDIGKASNFLSALMYGDDKFKEVTGINVHTLNYQPPSPELQNCVIDFISRAQHIMQYQGD